MEEALLVETGRRGAYKDVARIIVSMVIMAMLIWIVHKGYSLITNATKNGDIQGYEDNYIAIVFGVATVVSGLVYFIVGLIVVAELALECLAWLRRGDKEANNNQGTNMVYHLVYLSYEHITSHHHKD